VTEVFGQVPITAQRPTSSPLPRVSTQPADTRPRICGEPGCGTRLSIYNKTPFCSRHPQPPQAQRRRSRRPQRPAGTPQDWPGRACEGKDLGLFYAPDGARQANFRYTKARRLCQGCRFQLDCREWAVETGQEHGMWGGLAPDELRAERQHRDAAEERTRGAA
jgi:WhiB family redox-sensing transcriptional regulator